MLSDIRAEFASDFGISVTNATEKAYVDKLINDALNDLYTNNELYLSEREQIFNVGSDLQVITLPSEVDKVLAVRRYETRLRIGQDDMRPRYRSMSWTEPYLNYPYLRWRFKNRSCLKKEFLNIAPFTYTISDTVAGGFSLTITGKTNTANRITETITFGAADTTKTGTVSFTEYHSIVKSRVISQDIVITDADSNEVSVIPNNVLKNSYPYYQILDRFESSSSEFPLVEVLYKLKQDKLVNDTDSFLDDVYDKAVYWLAASFYYAKKPGEDSNNKALGYASKCKEVLAKINESYMRNSTSEIIWPQSTGSKVVSAIRFGGFDRRR